MNHDKGSFEPGPWGPGKKTHVEGVTLIDTSLSETAPRERGALRMIGRNAGVALMVSGIAFMGLGTLVNGGSKVAASPSITGGACSAPSASSVSDVFKNISTDQGCNNSEGQADFPITGWIAYNPGAATTVQLGDFYEGLSSHNFYWGAYTLTFGTCTDGAATSGTYNVTQGTGDYPSTVPTYSGVLATLTGGADGKSICPYSLTVQNEPSGHLNSSKNDLWIMTNGEAAQGHHTATESVKPPTIPGNETSTSTSTSTTTSTHTTTKTTTSTSTSTSTGTSTESVSASSTSTGGVQGINTPGTGGGSDGFFGIGLLLMISGGALAAGAVTRARQKK